MKLTIDNSKREVICNSWDRKEILKNQQAAKLCRELVGLLVDYAGDTGDNEGAVDVLKRKLEKAEKWDKLQSENMNIDFGLWADNDKTVERLKKRIEEYREQLPNMEFEQTNWCQNQIIELQKILDDKV